MPHKNDDENGAGPSTSKSEYTIPKPSRIKMKETKAEKAHRLYRREQRRLAKEDVRISRANGYAVSPPRQYREESMSPPRKRSTNTTTYSEIHIDDEGGGVGGGGGGGEWMGGYGRKAKEELEKREFQEKLSWMAGEDYGFSYSNNTGLEGYEDIHIPKRFKDAAGFYSSSSTSVRRNAASELGGGIPPIGSMSESEYTQFIREGMYAKKHKAELEENQRRQKLKEEKERLEEAKRERKRKEEDKKIKKLKLEKSENVERTRKEERGKWSERWKVLGEVGGDIELTNITFNDIPWPIHHPTSTSSSTSSTKEKEKKITFTLEGLTKDSIRLFLIALAEDTKTELRKIIRETIRLFHPDRFHGRVLTRVKENERDHVKQGVETVSRILNDLASEVK